MDRKTKALNTKKKILKSAFELIQKRGIKNVSVDSIVERAGVAKGSFYVHFSSKDALIAEYIARYVNKVDLDYQSFLASIPEQTPASQVITDLAEKIAVVLSSDIGYENLKFTYGIQLDGIIDTTALFNYNRALYKMLTDIINRGIRQEEFKAEMPAEMIARHYILALRGLTYEWLIRYPDFDLRKETHAHFKILLNGIKS